VRHHPGDDLGDSVVRYNRLIVDLTENGSLVSMAYMGFNISDRLRKTSFLILASCVIMRSAKGKKLPR